MLGDEERLRQLLTILVDNAIKHTKKGGEIRIKGARKGGATEISVKNTHSHIAPDELAKLFERFYQSDDSHRKRGHGLGLAIAKNIATRMNWSLRATSGKQDVTFRLSAQKG
jgi:signal transduction histidine kinase